MERNCFKIENSSRIIILSSKKECHKSQDWLFEVGSAMRILLIHLLVQECNFLNLCGSVSYIWGLFSDFERSWIKAWKTTVKMFGIGDREFEYRCEGKYQFLISSIPILNMLHTKIQYFRL